MLKQIVAIIVAVAFASAHARGGGHVTTWDANLFPGFTKKNFITDYGATCNGVADDSTAWNSFLTAASSASIALYIPPGSNCLSTANGSFYFSVCAGGAHVDCTPILPTVIWGYGASLDAAYLGTLNGFFPDNTHNALITTASAGATTLTLVNSGDSSKFSVGKWICISGLSTQRVSSYPPNWQVFEYKLVTNVSGTTITLNAPLKYSYKSTWPQADVGDAFNPNLGGPASAYVLNSGWNENLQIYGLRFKQTVNAVFGQQRTIALYDVSFDSPDGIAPSASETFSIFYSNLKSPEFDKIVDTLIVHNFDSKQLIFQSAMTNSATFTFGNASQSLNGTPANAVFNRVTVPSVRMGPTAYGHGTSFAINNSTVTTVQNPSSNICMNTIANGNTDLSFASAVFTMPKTASAANRNQLFAWAIPGQKYYFADSDGTNNSSPYTSFTITDFSEDASNYYVTTDIAGSLPTPTCNGHVCPCYTSYQAQTVTQQFTGPADLTPFAAH